MSEEWKWLKKLLEMPYCLLTLIVYMALVSTVAVCMVNKRVKQIIYYSIKRKRSVWGKLIPLRMYLLLISGHHQIPYACQYNPRFVYFLPTYWSSFMYCDLWPCMDSIQEQFIVAYLQYVWIRYSNSNYSLAAPQGFSDCFWRRNLLRVVSRL